MKKKLELRMYGFTCYNLSEIQKGIQYGHAVVEYGLKHSKDKEYLDWAKNWKTFIILNGGTSNDGRGYKKGSMEIIEENLKFYKIKFSKFHEPDLNFMLSGICLLVDERVFNRTEYPDFIEYLKEEKNWDSKDYVKAKLNSRADLINDYPDLFKKWLKIIGGSQNEFLRDYLKQFKLA